MNANEVMEALTSAGLTTGEARKRMRDATLEVLAEQLTTDEVAVVARVLPEDLRVYFAGATFDGGVDAAEIYERVRRRTGEPLGRVREAVQILVAALARSVPEEAYVRLARALPPELARVMEPRDFAPAPPHPAIDDGTLATGRPGSRHPLAEAPRK